MPQIKSAQKRARQTAVRTARNQHTKRLIRLTNQRLQRAVVAADKQAVASARSELDSRLDRAAKKNLMHPRKVARKKSQAASLAKSVTAWSSPTINHQNDRQALSSQSQNGPKVRPDFW